MNSYQINVASCRQIFFPSIINKVIWCKIASKCCIVLAEKYWGSSFGNWWMFCLSEIMIYLFLKVFFYDATHFSICMSCSQPGRMVLSFCEEELTNKPWNIILIIRFQGRFTVSAVNTEIYLAKGNTPAEAYLGAVDSIFKWFGMALYLMKTFSSWFGGCEK